MIFRRFFHSATVSISALLATATFSGTAHADAATAEKVATYAYGGGLKSGIEDMQNRIAANSENAEAQFGLGALQFLFAVEGLHQDLYRYGAGNQGGMGRAFLPVFRLPVPPNPNPETADYEKARAILERFVSRLEEAEATLAKVGDQSVKLPLTLSRIAVDINADGKIDAAETAFGILASTVGRGSNELPKAAQQMTIAFDTPDAKWLQGYSNALMSVANFFLSVDFESTYDATFHNVFGADATPYGRQFGNAKGDPEEIAALNKKIADLKNEETPFTNEQRKRLSEIKRERRKIQRDKKLTKTEKAAQLAQSKDELDRLGALQSAKFARSRQIRELEKQVGMLDPQAAGSSRSFEGFLEPITLLHSINWPVTDPDRLKTVRLQMKKVMQLNHETWKLVRAETDNDREWLPNAKQTSPFPGMKVTDETINGWLETVKSAEQVLDGELLIPSLRFGRGINMKRFFEEAKRFDLVLFLTGPNSISFVEKGPIWDQRLMRAMSRPMGRNFGAYMIWFN